MCLKGDRLFLQYIHLPAKVFLHIKTQLTNPVALTYFIVWAIAPFRRSNLGGKTGSRQSLNQITYKSYRKKS